MNLTSISVSVTQSPELSMAESLGGIREFGALFPELLTPEAGSGLTPLLTAKALPADGSRLPPAAAGMSLPPELQQQLEQLSAEDRALLADWSAQDWQQWMMQPKTGEQAQSAPTMTAEMPSLDAPLTAESDQSLATKPESEGAVNSERRPLDSDSEREPEVHPESVTVLPALFGILPEPVASGRESGVEPLRYLAAAQSLDQKPTPAIDSVTGSRQRPTSLPELQTSSQTEALLPRLLDTAGPEPEHRAPSIASNASPEPAIPPMSIAAAPVSETASRSPLKSGQPPKGSTEPALLPDPTLTLNAVRPAVVAVQTQAQPLEQSAPPVAAVTTVGITNTPPLTPVAPDAEALLPATDSTSSAKWQQLSPEAQQQLAAMDGKVLARLARLPQQAWQSSPSPQQNLAPAAAETHALNQIAEPATASKTPAPAVEPPMLSLMGHWLSNRSAKVQAPSERLAPLGASITASAAALVPVSDAQLPLTDRDMGVSAESVQPATFSLERPSLVIPAQAETRVPSSGLEPASPATDGLPAVPELLSPVQKTEASSSTPTSAPVLSSDPRLDFRQAGWHEKFAEQLQGLKYLQLKDAEIRLDPPELGALKIQLSLQPDGVSQVHIQAAVAETRQLIEQSLPRLRELFQQQGLALAQANVSSGGQGQNQSQSQQQPAPERSASGSWTQAGTDRAEETPRVVAPSPSRDVGRIDHYA